jgi:hypothetical protein
MIAKGQIPIAINDISKGIQGSCAVSTANKPGINVRPIGSSDLYVAELIKRGFDYVWSQNRGQEIIFDLAKEAKTGSLGWLDIKYDESKGKYGKIVLASDNPLDYFYEKKSRKSDKADSPVIKAHLVTKKYAKENYNIDDEDLDFSPIPKDEEPSKSKEGNPGDGYVNASEGKKDSGFNQEEDDQVWEIEAWLIKKVKEYRILTIDQAAAIKTFVFITKKEQKDALELLVASGDQNAKIKDISIEKRVMRIIVGKKLISEEDNPYGLDSDGDPVVPKIPLGHDRSYSGFFVSPTYRAIEISKSRNKRRMQTIYVISKNIDAPIIKPAGCKWDVSDEKHGDQLEVPKDAAFAPSRLLPGTTSSELMAMEQRDEVALNDEYDMNDVMRGKLPPGVDSGKLVIALQDQAGTMSTPFIGVLEGVIEKAAKVILALMLRHWPRELWERLIDDEEKKSWQPEKQKQIDPLTGEVVPPNPDDIGQKWLAALEMVKPSDPSAQPKFDLENLDIKIQAGSTTPTNRMAKRLDSMEMVKAGVYPPEVALEYMDDPLKDKAIALIKQRQQAEQQAMMMKGSK